MAVILNASTSSGFVQSADTSGEINLQSNGSTKLSVLSTGVSGTIVQGTAVASTSGTSIDFTGIPSWAKKITVMLSGVSHNNAGTAIILQIGDSGGIETTGYVAGGVGSNGTFGGTGTGMALYDTTAAATVLESQAVISLLTGNTWSFAVNSYSAANGGAAGGGTKTLSATLDRVRITTALGTATFDAGTINIQYEG
jgi:hypothetical protein